METTQVHYMRDARTGVVFFAGDTRIGSWRRRPGLSWASLEMRAAIRVQGMNALAADIGIEAAVAEFKAGRA